MEAKPEGPKPGSPRLVDLNRLAHTPGYKLAIKSPEDPTELQARIRTAEAEAAHARRKDLLLHFFVMAVVAVAFVLCVFLVLTRDPASGLPDKAMGLIAVIISAGVGYITGRGSR